MSLAYSKHFAHFFTLKIPIHPLKRLNILTPFYRWLKRITSSPTCHLNNKSLKLDSRAWPLIFISYDFSGGMRKMRSSMTARIWARITRPSGYRRLCSHLLCPPSANDPSPLLCVSLTLGQWETCGRATSGLIITFIVIYYFIYLLLFSMSIKKDPHERQNVWRILFWDWKWWIGKPSFMFTIARNQIWSLFWSFLTSKVNILSTRILLTDFGVEGGIFKQKLLFEIVFYITITSTVSWTTGFI